MATKAQRYVDQTHADVVEFIDLIERAQAIAAARSQETTALGGGAAAVDGFDFSVTGLTAQQFYDCLSSLAAMGDVLGAHKTNIYRVKTGLGE